MFYLGKHSKQIGDEGHLTIMVTFAHSKRLPFLSLVLRLKAKRVRGHIYHLMQPEVADYVIRATQELADILGLSLPEVR